MFYLVAVRLYGFRFTCFTYFETHTVFLRILQFCTKILQNAKMCKTYCILILGEIGETIY